MNNRFDILGTKFETQDMIYWLLARILADLLETQAEYGLQSHTLRRQNTQ